MNRTDRGACARSPGRKAALAVAGKTLFVSGGSRSIGLAIAFRPTRDGPNVALIANNASAINLSGTEPQADLFVDHA